MPVGRPSRASGREGPGAAEGQRARCGRRPRRRPGLAPSHPSRAFPVHRWARATAPCRCTRPALPQPCPPAAIVSNAPLPFGTHCAPGKPLRAPPRPALPIPGLGDGADGSDMRGPGSRALRLARWDPPGRRLRQRSPSVRTASGGRAGGRRRGESRGSRQRRKSSLHRARSGPQHTRNKSQAAHGDSHRSAAGRRAGEPRQPGSAGGRARPPGRVLRGSPQGQLRSDAAGRWRYCSAWAGGAHPAGLPGSTRCACPGRRSRLRASGWPGAAGARREPPQG